MGNFLGLVVAGFLIGAGLDGIAKSLRAIANALKENR